MILKNKNIIFKIRRSKVTDYAALKEFVFSHVKAASLLKEYFHALEMDKTHIYVVFTY